MCLGSGAEEEDRHDHGIDSGPASGRRESDPPPVPPAPPRGVRLDVSARHGRGWLKEEGHSPLVFGPGAAAPPRGGVARGLWEDSSVLRGGIVVGVLAFTAAATMPALAAYGPGRVACELSDARIPESSGIASASWADDFIWTHNDSGDQARFFGVETATCEVTGVYRVTGSEAVDWEDMTRSGTTLHFGDIGDNDRKRASIRIYDVPEPARGTPPGALPPAATRVVTYPDGSQDAESLFVDPASGRLGVVTKVASGNASVYLAPRDGNGVMERVASVPVASATGADATADRIIVRNYLGAWEWVIRPGETLANTLGREPTPVTLPLTAQGEAVAYARDGAGLWTSSEGKGSGVHYLARTVPSDASPAPDASDSPSATSPESGSARPAGGPDRDWLLPAAIAVAAVAVALLATGRHRRRC